MKWFRHIVSCIIWTVFGLYVVLVAMLHIPFVQHGIGSATANALGDKLGTKVSIGKINLGLLNRVVIDDATMLDQNGKEMVKAARISVRLELTPLLDGRISIASAQVFGTHIRLYQASATAKPNYQFVLDSLASGDDNAKKSPIDLHIGSFIMRRSSVSYDRLDMAAKKGMADWAHIALNDISANVQVGVIKPDSVNVKVRRLAFKERSGLELNKLSMDFEAGKSHCRLSDFELKTKHSTISIPQITASYTLKDGLPDLATATFRGRLERVDVATADIAKFLPQVAKLDITASMVANVYGHNGSISVAPLCMHTSNGATLDASGTIKLHGDNKPTWHADIRQLSIPATAVANVANAMNGAAGDNALNKMERLGNISLSGSGGTTPQGGTEASCHIGTGVGSANVAFALSADNSFNAHLDTDGITLEQLLDDERLGTMKANLDMKGSLRHKSSPVVYAKGTVGQFSYNGYDYKNISIDGSYDTGELTGLLQMDDPNGKVAVTGMVKQHNNTNAIDIMATIDRLAPQAMKLTNKWGSARFTAKAEMHATAKNISDATGTLTINDFKMEKPDGDYELERLAVASGQRNGQRYMTMNSDFGHVEMVGQADIASIGTSIANFVRGVLPTLPGLPRQGRATANKMLVSAEITKTDWLENIMQVPLQSKGAICVNGKIDDRTRELYLNCTAPEICYAGQTFQNLSVALTSPENTLRADIKGAKVLGDGDLLWLDVTGNAHDNRLETTLKWNGDGSDGFNGTLNVDASFRNNGRGNEAEVRIKPSSIAIGNAEWTVRPATITVAKNAISVEDFAVTHDKQHIIVNGRASASENDSLNVDLNGIDVAYVLNLVDFHAVDFAGRASGRACITKPFGDMTAKAKLTVSDFTFENGRMGTLHANAEWNNSEKQIDINATANDGADAMTMINGYVSPERNFIDLDIKALGTHLDFVKSYTSSFMGDLQGQAYGGVRLHGPLDGMDLTGELVVSGKADISITGCSYRMANDTIRFKVDEIEFANATIYDSHGNSGWINGGIHHHNLTSLTYDIGIESDGMLVYDIRDFGDDTFYGTVFGSGDFDIHGRDDGVTMDFDITPHSNSSFVYNASSQNGVSNQNFIKWSDRAAKARHSTGTAAKDIFDDPQSQQSSDMRINFALNMNPDATIKLLMDSKTNDYITLNGSGALRATYYNKGAFNIYGTYRVAHGTYGVTIQNLIKKNFVFSDGGTIVFRGNPYDAELNLQAVHTVNGVSLSDLNIGNSFSSNTIRVNCLMNISGQPNKPIVDFDMDMPTVSSDEKQMIRSVINSEDEMNQQVLYLLAIGRFYPQVNNNSTAQDERQQSQTSLAMQSLLSGTLSSQINNVLNTVIKSNNWNFGANISTGDEGWNNAEYEGLLSGRLLNNRLLINGQFGYRDNATKASTSFIGDFDIRYLLLPNGNIAIKMYNETNDRYFTKSSLNTQGIGLIMKKDFTNLGDLFRKGKKNKIEKEAKQNAVGHGKGH